jgi:hypothetical protein
MSLIWAVIAPFVPVVAVLAGSLAIGLFIVWLVVGGALWAARAGRPDGVVLDENPEWLAELPAELAIDTTSSDGERR